jgi:rfaE bifunctional protein kinase chain/domain
MNICEILNRDRLLELLNHFSLLKVGVIGDFALDAYWQVDMTRAQLSRETPHFSRPVVSERYAPGAAGNVAQNLAALGVRQIGAFSVLGEDLWGGCLRNELQARRINTEGLLTRPEQHTFAYIKPLLVGYETQQEDARLDIVNSQPLLPEAEEELLRRFEGQIDSLQAVLLVDQIEDFGTLTPRLRQRLVELAQTHPHIHFLVDSRQRIAGYRGMILKPNRKEALAAWKPGGDQGYHNQAELEEAGKSLSRLSGCSVYLTMGESGVIVCDADSGQVIAAAPVRPPIDIVGAGDAFFAALATSLASGGTPCEAGAVANLAAAVTVEKLRQTGTATQKEILERYDLAACAY